MPEGRLRQSSARTATPDYVERILRARVYDVARETPLDPAPRLSARLGARVLLKREDLQETFSFKVRGAYNKIAALAPEVRARGVVTASAGNHAQGVALAARRLGTAARIVMPRTTPSVKIDAVRALGGDTILFGDSYDDAQAHAREIERAENLVFVPAYDDPDVIAGQGTIALEILRQHRAPLDAIFVPVGGGGLIAGIAAWVKYLEPTVQVIGVEPDDAACLHAALAAGQPVTLAQVGLFADGVAVKRVGDEPFRIARTTVDEVVRVGSDEICAAIKDVFDDTRSVAEPAGALAVAGLKRWVEQREAAGRTLVAVVSGANVNFDRLRHVAERAELGEHREALLAVRIPERPGSFLAFCRALPAVPVTEFNYRFGGSDGAHVFVGVGLSRGEAERREIIAALEHAGHAVVDLTGDELAKLHVRFMVGGRAPGLADERLYRFEFPERPGALLQFLERLGEAWNISLFHYRNHGAAYGRVLAGIQVAAAARPRFAELLAATGYEHHDETENPAYRFFLR